MPDERSDEANIRAGIAVIGAVVCVAVLLWAWMAWKSSRRLDYVVWFPADVGVYGLRNGAPVRVGGIRMGEVTFVTPQFKDGRLDCYDVGFALRGDVRLYQGAIVEGTGDPVSGDGAIDIVRIGDMMVGNDNSGRAPAPTPLVAGTRIKASPVPDYRTLAGHRGSRYLRTLLTEWGPLKDRFGAIAEDAPARVRPVVDDARPLIEQVRADYRDWRAQYERLRTDAERAIAKLGPGADAPPDAVLPTLRAAGRELPSVSEAERSRAQFINGTLRYAVKLVDDLRSHGKAFADALEDADHGLAKGMADFSIASQELAATETEALFAPWRLFASPGAAERARLAGIDRARAFAESAVEFDRALRGIREALERDGQVLQSTPGLAELLRTQLEIATRTFGDSTGRMLQLLIGDPVPGSAPGTPPVAPEAGGGTLRNPARGPSNDAPAPETPGAPAPGAAPAPAAP